MSVFLMVCAFSVAYSPSSKNGRRLFSKSLILSCQYNKFYDQKVITHPNVLGVELFPFLLSFLLESFQFFVCFRRRFHGKQGTLRYQTYIIIFNTLSLHGYRGDVIPLQIAFFRPSVSIDSREDPLERGAVIVRIPIAPTRQILHFVAEDIVCVVHFPLIHSQSKKKKIKENSKKTSPSPQAHVTRAELVSKKYVAFTPNE